MERGEGSRINVSVFDRRWLQANRREMHIKKSEAWRGKWELLLIQLPLIIRGGFPQIDILESLHVLMPFRGKKKKKR